MRFSPKLLSWLAPVIVVGLIGLGMVVVSNITGLHLSVEKKTISDARLQGTFELFSTVRHVDLPKGHAGVDAGVVRRFFQVGQQLSCRCILKFEPSCSQGPCGGDLRVWRAGVWSKKVPFTYLGHGRFAWTAPGDSCGCYGGHGIQARIASHVQIKVAATNQVAGKWQVFEFRGRQSSRWAVASRSKGFPPRLRVIAAVDAAVTQF
ncbi:MAG: hypothetical protein M3P18_11760 [Actinomycetota bacterium]|nr:hypothetical protein [Actinomycetota bacterium]